MKSKTRKNRRNTNVYTKKAKGKFKDVKIHYKKQEFPTDSHSGDKAFGIVRKYLYGNKNPDKNYITFVNVAGDYYHNKIYSDTKIMNFIDHQPYYKVEKMAQQMVHMMANLFKDKDYKKAKGATTIGSSEAIYVSTVMNKFAWEERNKKPAANRCNMIWSENTHINWDKAARWNDIRARKIKLKHLKWTFGAEEVEKLINPNTMAVICTVCTTRTAQNDNVAEINEFLKKYHKKTGIFIPIHIDAAIGGFLVPFHGPKSLKWSFELEHVKSINVSFHKYGGTYAGLGMIIVKSDYKLPDKMRFFFDAEHMNLKDTKITNKKWLKDPHSEGQHVNKRTDYLKELNPAGHLDLQVNFSKSSSQIVSAFYIFMKLGREGYRKRIMKCLKTSKILSTYLNSLRTKKGNTVLVQMNEPYYPVLSYYLNDKSFPLKEVLTRLSENDGYSIAAYEMGASKDIVFRLVFKHNVTTKEAQTFRNAWKTACDKIYYNSNMY